jgi:hypothetical protein
MPDILRSDDHPHKDGARASGTPDLLRDLGVTPRSLVAVDDAALLAALGDRAHTEASDLGRLPSLAARVRGGGTLWLVVPARSRTLDPDDISAAERSAGLVDGRTVAPSPHRVAIMLSQR